MKNVRSIRSFALPLLMSAAVYGFAPNLVQLHAQAAQTPATQAAPQTAGQSATQSLLDKAHALEVRGRMDMATQTWQQVLLSDPNNVDALAGLARSAKLSGN